MLRRLVSSINSDSRGTELAASLADLFVLRTRLPIEPVDGFTSISEHAVGIFPMPIDSSNVCLTACPMPEGNKDFN